MHLINMHNIPATYNIYKDYAFRGFSLCPDLFLKCQRFMNLVIYFIRAMSSLILSYPFGSFLFFYYAAYWSSEEKEDHYGWG